MCGRYLQSAPPERLGREYDLDIRDNFPPRYNIAPTQPVSVIYRNERGARVYGLMRWGFIPSWARKAETRPLINARAETIAEKPTFRSAWKRRRCLVPADGFYEWKTEGGAKRPFCIRRADGGVFSFAGIWETARDPDGGEIDTVAIITTAAGPDLAALHSREPVVIAREDYRRWLEADECDAAELLELLKAAPAGFWRVYEISRALNNARNEGPQLIEPLATQVSLL